MIGHDCPPADLRLVPSPTSSKYGHKKRLAGAMGISKNAATETLVARCRNEGEPASLPRHKALNAHVHWKRGGNAMRRTFAIVLAAMLASSMAFAQSNTNSGAGVAGKPGSKSGPAMTKSGSGSSNQNGTNPDQSNVKGMPGNKSGPAVKPPSKKD